MGLAAHTGYCDQAEVLIALLNTSQLAIDEDELCRRIAFRLPPLLQEAVRGAIVEVLSYKERKGLLTNDQLRGFRNAQRWSDGCFTMAEAASLCVILQSPYHMRRSFEFLCGEPFDRAVATYWPSGESDDPPDRMSADCMDTIQELITRIHEHTAPKREALFSRREANRYARAVGLLVAALNRYQSNFTE